jgi:tRNA(Arg) A34 adenosine deaminase TadA
LAITGLAQNLHAVESVLRQAAETWGDQDLCGGVLFSTCEPCPRCTTLAIQANITTLVFGVPLASIADQGRIAGPVTGRQLIEQSSAVIEVISGVQAEACQALCE